MKILDFFLFLWVIFALLDPDPDPATQINADPDPDTDPVSKPCLQARSLRHHRLHPAPSRRGQDTHVCRLSTTLS